MGAFRAASTALLILIAAAAWADCTSAFRLISSRASSPNLVSEPIAWSGSVLAVAKYQEGTSSSIWVGFYNENLDSVAPNRLYATNARAIAGLVWTGSEFALLYRTDVPNLLLQRMTMLGDPIGAPIEVTPSRTVYAGDEIDLAWSSALDAYVVARVVSQGSNKGLWITVLEKDGTQRVDRSVPVFIAPQSQLQIAVTASGIIGAFFLNVNENLAFARLGPTGPVISRVISDTLGTDLNVTAYQELFVVTRAVRTATKTNIRWLVVDSSQEIVRPDSLLIEAPGEEVLPRALITNGSELALTYVDSPERAGSLDDVFRLRRFTINGTMISDAPFSDDVSVSRGSTDWRFVWTGMSYIAAPVRSSSDRLNSYLARYCPLLVEVIGPTTVIVGSTVTFRPSTTGGAPDYEYVWSFSNELRTDRGEVMVRTYNQKGTYTATVTVTDDNGVTDTGSLTFVVVDEEEPPPPPDPKRRTVRH